MYELYRHGNAFCCSKTPIGGHGAGREARCLNRRGDHMRTPSNRWVHHDRSSRRPALVATGGESNLSTGLLLVR